MAATKEKNKVTETIVIVKKCAKTGRTLETLQIGPNIVTNEGDKYYAQRGAASLPTYTFNKGHLVAAKSMSVNPSKTSTFSQLRGMGTTYTGRQSLQSTYPKAGDTDTDNTGRTADAVTYKVIYGSTSANYTFAALAICRPGGVTSASAVALRVLCNAKTLSAAQKFVKTSAITVTVYVNHLFNGI